jgi:hypothetical protein
MSEREELARLIANQLDRLFLNRELEPAHQDYQLADALLAAGWRQTRTVSSAEELNALPLDSVVINERGDAWQKAGRNWYLTGSTGGSKTVPYMPATVIHEGEPS